MAGVESESAGAGGDLDPGGGECGTEGSGESDWVGAVAVDAEGFGAGGGEEAQGLGAGFRGVGDEGVGVGAGDQGAVGLVAAIGEDLGGRPQSARLAGAKEGAAREAEEDQARIDRLHRGGDGVREGGVAGGLIVKCAVGFHMGERDAHFTGQALKGKKLFGDELKDIGGGEREFEAAEVCGVRIAGMRAHGDAVLAGERERVAHGGFVAGMGAAGDVCGGDERHQFGVVWRAFAEIAIQVEVHVQFGGRASWTCRRAKSRSRRSRSAWASARVISWKRTGSPGRNCARPAKSTDATAASRG